MDFKILNEHLLRRARELVPEWLPGGSPKGREWKCGDINGGPGGSFSVNMDTGVWTDFAQKGVGGGDLISLYAMKHGHTQGQAAKELASLVGYTNGSGKSPAQSNELRAGKKEDVLVPPPADAPEPSLVHYKHGSPSGSWCYLSATGEVMFYQARYDIEGRKEFCPWSWSETQEKWVMKAWPKPRPLYGLDDLTERPTAPVLIVEGEKTAEAARKLLGKNYVVVTWQGGSSSWDKADWSPVRGRTVLIWPDADNSKKTKAGIVLPYHQQPGPAAGFAIAALLVKSCKEVKLINVSDRPDGWDAADAVAEGWTFANVVEWAKTRVNVVKVQVPVIHSSEPEVMPPKKVQEKKVKKEKPPAEHFKLTAYDDLGIVTKVVEEFWRECGLAMQGNGQPIMNMANIGRLLRAVDRFQDLVWFDEFYNDFYTCFSWTGEPGIVRPWKEDDDISLLNFLQNSCGFTKITRQSVEQAVRFHAMRRIANEPREWMDTLIWDQQPRIQDFFVNCFGAEDSEYVRAASRNWWISMAARTYQPGCQVDNMVILEGPQGVYKSTVLSIVGGKWYGVISESPSSKDFYLALHGKLLLEVAELDSFNRAEDSTIKRIITVREDRFRAPYERKPSAHPRRCVLVGTTNRDEYLKDPSGARRFWPIDVKRIDKEWVTRDREQLFAEAVHRFKAGETWWQMPVEETMAHQAARQSQDLWTEPILAWLNDPGVIRDEVTVRQIAVNVLKIDDDKLDQRTANRISSILKFQGWYKPKSGKKRVGKEVLNLWLRPQNDESKIQLSMPVKVSELTNYAPSSS